MTTVEVGCNCRIIQMVCPVTDLKAYSCFTRGTSVVSPCLVVLQGEELRMMFSNTRIAIFVPGVERLFFYPLGHWKLLSIFKLAFSCEKETCPSLELKLFLQGGHRSEIEIVLTDSGR